MSTTALLDLKNFTPPIIKNQELWADFLDAVSDELDNVRVEIEKKNRLFETELYTDIYELINIAKSFGYNPNLLLKEDLAYVQQEVSSIVFKIKNKAIYSYYNYLFKLIPKAGSVYILFQDYLTLVRAIDWTVTINNLVGYDLATPFIGLETILHYDTYRNNPVFLDNSTLFYLDESIIWYLDQDIVIKPSQHLAIEYQIEDLILNDLGESVLATKKYFAYLEQGVHYGRKVTNTPHIGLNLSMPIGNQGFANQYSVAENTLQGTDAEQYTIPLLKTYASVTDSYRSIVNAAIITDPPIITILNPIEEAFYYLAVGIGTKSFFNIAHQPLMTDLDLHISFEDLDTNIFKDNYSTLYAEVSGSFNIDTGISGNTIIWNGIDTEGVIKNLTLDDADREWNFWITPDVQVVNNPTILYIANYINVYYNTVAETLDVIITGDTATATASIPISIATFEAGEFMISISFTQGATLKLFKDGVEIVSVDASLIGIFSSIGDLYLGSAIASNYYIGKIDELRIYSKVLALADRLELFTRKLGTLNYLAKEVYRKRVSLNQIMGTSAWELVAGSIPANSINGEILAKGDDTTYTFTNTLNYANLSKGYLTIEYYSFPSNYILTADNRGRLIGDRAVGTIDFITGEYTFETRKPYLVNKEQISNTELSVINYVTVNPSVVESSCTLYYQIGSTSYAITDDGIGNFVEATTISLGTINYTTGAIDVTFNTTTDAGVEIYIVYKYYKWSIPTLDTNIIAEYKILDNLDITEVGVLNVDGVANIYSNIPKTEFNSVTNHSSYQFFVEQ